MKEEKKVKLPFSESPQSADAAPQHHRYDYVEKVFIRVDVAKIQTATGYSIWEATSPQFEGASVVHADRNMAIHRLLEKLPDAYWNEIGKTTRQ